MVSCLANSIFLYIAILMLTSPLLKFVSLHIDFNYFCTNLEMGSLTLSKWKPFF